MTNRDKVLRYLRSISPHAATNSQIRKATGVEPHQQVYQITQLLMGEGLIQGEQRGREWFFSVGEAQPISETHLRPESTHGMPPAPDDEPLLSRTVARLPRPSRTKVLSLIAACIVVLACAVLRAYFSVVEPRQMVMQARDWQEISFETDITGELSEADDPAITDLTGAGILAGESQYLLSGVTGAVHEPLPPRWMGGLTVTIEDIEVVLVEVSDWIWAVDCDADTGLYYVQLCSDDRCFDYKPPFEAVPSPLVHHVVYRSVRAETVLLSSATPGDAEVLPVLRILADEPTSFGWNMRRGCRVSIGRSYDWRSGTQNRLLLLERCEDERAFASLYDQAMDSEARLQYFSYGPPGGTSTLLLLPSSFEIQADGLGTIGDSGDDCMLLIRPAATGGVVQLVAQPQHPEVRFSIYLPGVDLSLEELLAEIEPTTREIALVGPAGKVAVGLETTKTDELSEVTMTFVDWPNLKWHNELLTSEDGEDTPQQFLSGRGMVNSVIVNGEEIVPTRWDRLAPDIRGALLTALGALLGATIAAVARLAVRQD